MPARVDRRWVVPVGATTVLATALTALLVGVAPPSSAAPEPNDAVAGAREIQVGETLATNTLEATRETDEPTPCGTIDHTVWFAVTPATDGMLSVRTLTASPLMDTVLAVHTAGPGPYPVSPIVGGCNDDHAGRRSKVTFAATADTTYYLQVGHYGGTRQANDPGPGPLQVQVVAQPVPGNDDAGTPEVLTSTESGSAAADTTLATHAGTDPSQPSALSRTLWYRWTAPSDGVATFQAGSEDPETPDTFLFAFPQTGGTTSATALAANDDVDAPGRDFRSRIAFAVDEGTTYRVLAGTKLRHDPFTLSWSMSDPVDTTTSLQAAAAGPGLVDLSAAVTRTAGGAPASGSVAISDGADVVATLPLTAGTATRRLRYRTGGAHSYTAVFQPDSLDELPSTSPAAALTVAAPPRPAHDDFADAATITGASGTAGPVGLLGATRQSGEPTLDPDVDDASVWYRWTAPVSDAFTFTVASDDAGVDAVVGALRGLRFADLTVLRSGREPAGPGAQVTFSAIEGRSYYLLVDAVVPGAVSLAWSRAGGPGTSTELDATSPAPYEVDLASTTTGATSGTVVFLRDGATIGRVDTTTGLAELSLDFQRPGASVFTAEFYPDDAAVRPSASPATDLTVAAPVAPANDAFANAETITTRTSTTGTTYGATADSGTPATGLPSNADTSVWYRWVAPRNGSYEFTARRLSVTTDLVLRAFEGTALGNLRTLDENDDLDGFPGISRVGISAVAGRTYYLLVDSYELSSMGQFGLTWKQSIAASLGPTATALGASTSPRTVVLTATVDDLGSVAHPPGYVEFFEGATSRGVVPVTASSATAVRTLTFVTPGAHAYRAVFVPDDYLLAQSTSPSRTVTVAEAPTTTTLTAPNRVRRGAQPLVTAVVRFTALSSVPLGRVRFSLDGRVLRTVALSGGRASFRLPALAVGTARLVAGYLGTAGVAPSSASRSIVVRR